MLNTQGAINYNRDRGYSPQAIGIIQSVVNANTAGAWNSQSVSQVHVFQSKRGQLGTPDGKVGPKTLGAMIGELQGVKRTAEANVLKQYPYNYASAPSQSAPINPVTEFAQYMSMPLRFERIRQFDPKVGKMVDRWRLACVFKVHVGLNPLLTADEVLKYEYRQFIRGGVWTRNVGSPWLNAPDGNKAFSIPAYTGCAASVGLPSAAVPHGILDFDRWKEDGEVRLPQNRMYGHRISALVRDGRCQDEWLPHEVGRDYYGSDMPSVTGTWTGTPVEVWFELYFKGFVVEVTEDDYGNTTPIRVVQSKNWACYSSSMILNNYNSAVAV